MVDQSPTDSLPPVEPLPDVPVVPLLPDPSPAAFDSTPPGVAPYVVAAAPYAPPPGYLPPPPPPPGAPAGYYPSANPYGYAYATPIPPRGLSIASMVTGIVGVVFGVSYGLGLFPAIAAIITGHLAQKRQPSAKGFWLTGLICGYVGLALSLLGIAFLIFVIAIVANSAGDLSNYPD
jgi:Domain of unknown function (DUF4190)